jgi:hypothetical protein
MKLAGKIVHLVEDSFQNKLTGETVQMFKVYLEPASPIDPAFEISVAEDVFRTLKLKEQFECAPLFSIRQRGSNQIVVAKALR